MQRLFLATAFALAVLLAGCATTPAGPPRPKKSERIAPDSVGQDLRKGADAAVVAFNSFMVSYDGDGPADEVVPAPELRRLNQALLAVFMAEMRQLPELTWMPPRRVRTNRQYRRLSYLWGEASARGGLPLGQDMGVGVAPPGLKYMYPPAAQLGLRGDGDLVDAFRTVVADIRSDFHEQMNYLAWRLGVDLVVIVNNRLRLRRVGDDWQGELELVEIIAVGKQSSRGYAYARYSEGPFPSGGVPQLPEAALHFVSVPTGGLKRGDELRALPAWPQLAAPMQAAAATFAESWRRLR